MKMINTLLTISITITITITITMVSSTPISAQRCEEGTSAMAADAMCPNGFCSKSSMACESESGFRRQCGSESTNPSDDSGRLRSILSSSIFDEILKHRNDSRCPGKGFYNYNSFIAAATAFGGFGTTGNQDTRKREIAAFLAQTSHETSGGWATAPDGPYAWGYCFVNETNQDFAYCVPSSNWPCASGKKYYGRGPLQITYNFNYGEAGRGIGVDLINNPDLVAIVPILSFTTALWFWMTPQGNKPSCHDVIIGKWIPSNDDRSAGRVPGYGVITNIINGGIECGTEHDSRVADRIGFYKRYCDILGLGYGDDLDCANQKPFS